MGFFDFFKKKAAVEPQIKRVVFTDIENWVEKKSKEIEYKEKDVFDLIQTKIDSFTEEIPAKIKIVQEVDVNGKKSEDKFKSLTIEGRKKYIEALNDFIANLNNLERKEFETFTKKVDKAFLDFNKNSKMSYERATVLIGKEMADIRDVLKNLSGDLIKIFGDNKKTVAMNKAIFAVKQKLNQINEADKTLKDISDERSSLDLKIKDKEDEKKIILEEIEKIKQSEEYAKNIALSENIKIFENAVEKNILSLRQLIDFKGLANFFHIFEDKMEIVKEHREDFQINFKKDDGKAILNLLEDSKLKNEKISERIAEIHGTQEKIMIDRLEIKPDTTEDLYVQTTKILLDIGNLKNEKSREEKRVEKIKASKEELLGNLVDDFKKVDIELDI